MRRVLGQQRQVRRDGCGVAAHCRAGYGVGGASGGDGFDGGAGKGYGRTDAVIGAETHLRPEVDGGVNEGGDVATAQDGAGVVQRAQFVGDGDGAAARDSARDGR